MGCGGQGSMIHDEDDHRAERVEVLAELRGIAGVESVGLLLEAAKITGKDVIYTLRQAIDSYAAAARGRDACPFHVD